jgi:ribosomal protein S6--L-glutamate ligase
VRVAFLLVRHSNGRISHIIPEAARLLTSKGVAVDVLYPDEEMTDLAHPKADHHLYVLKAKTEASLSLAGTLHTAGAAILNPYWVTVMCRDKAITHKVLQTAGAPVPEAYFGLNPRGLTALLDAGPLIVKPNRGSQGRGVQVVRTAEELHRLKMGTEAIFAQRYLEPDGRDCKLYRIGGEIFGVRRIWPATTFKEKMGDPFEPSSELIEITLLCGEAFSIDLYGLDVIFSGDRPYVVDFSSFPGFKGVPKAAQRLADHIHATAQRGLRGERPLKSTATGGAGWQS